LIGVASIASPSLSRSLSPPSRSISRISPYVRVVLFLGVARAASLAPSSSRLRRPSLAFLYARNINRAFASRSTSARVALRPCVVENVSRHVSHASRIASTRRDIAVRRDVSPTARIQI
jgi:hypothetical protein